MAWSTPLTAVSNTALTAAQWNASVRDNLAETAPAKASTAGRFFATSGANTIAERVPTTDTVTASANVTSTSYVPVTGGPVVSVTTGPVALIMFSTFLSNDTTGSNTFASYQASGATSVASSDAWALGQAASGANRPFAASRVRLHTGLTAGSNAFVVHYRVSGGTGQFSDRSIAVIPF